MKTIVAAFLAAIGLFFAGRALADEGMFTYEHFPSAQVQGRYGFKPDRDWLDRVRLSAVRVGNGCSGSFVGKDGLVLTNHHCARDCIDKLSTADDDLLKDGFAAAARARERRCPGLTVSQLVGMTDVTAEVNRALLGSAGQARVEAIERASVDAENRCAADARFRCSLISLYDGGKFTLYKYRVFDDVRLVFAPEADIAIFGGDLDNFSFPRHTLDMSILRVYADDAPLSVDHWLPLARTSAREGDLVFIAGAPSSTSRQKTVAELEFARNHILPQQIAFLSELRGLLRGFAGRGPEQARATEQTRLEVENALKFYKGQLKALGEGGLLDRKRTEEAQLRTRIDADGRLASAAGAWREIAGTMSADRRLYDRYVFLEGDRGPLGFQGDLFAFARLLVRSAEERAKPDGQRLPEYADARFPAVEQQLLSDGDASPELEAAMLGLSLSTLRSVLTSDDPAVRAALGTETPEALAERVVRGTALADRDARKRLLDGGPAAIQASRDPMIVLARAVDAEARAIRRRYEAEVAVPMADARRRIAEARFVLDGVDVAPEASRSPRIGFGQVKGWTEAGVAVPAFTTLAGLYERATGTEPFRLPRSWLLAKSALDPNTRFNLVTTNDVVGGNSGSPLFNRNLELIGLAFDGNVYATAGEYGFDSAGDRCIGLDVEAIRTALGKVYGETRLLREMEARPAN